jgi:hypothetical protein
MEFSSNTPTGARSLLEITANGYSFRWTEYLSAGFRAFGSEFGIYVAFTLVYIAISMAGGLIPYVGNAIGLLVNPALVAGFIYYGRAQYVNDHRDFNTFFGGFRQPQWIALVLQNVLANLFMIAAVAAVVLPFFYSPIIRILEELQHIENLPQDEVAAVIMGLWSPELSLALIIGLMVAIIVSTFICLAPYFIIYRSLSFSEAMYSSLRVVKMRFFGFLGLIIILWLIMILGVMLCCVGFLAAFPVYHLTLLAAFRDIMGEDHVPTPVTTH